MDIIYVMNMHTHVPCVYISYFYIQAFVDPEKKGNSQNFFGICEILPDTQLCCAQGAIRKIDK